MVDVSNKLCMGWNDGCLEGRKKRRRYEKIKSMKKRRVEEKLGSAVCAEESSLQTS